MLGDNRPQSQCFVSVNEEHFRSIVPNHIDIRPPYKEGVVLIDTGSTATILDVGVAKELRLPETETNTAVSGVGGDLPARQFTGAIFVTSFGTVIPTTFIAIPILERHGFVAILGMDIMEQYVLLIDGPNNRIALRDHKGNRPGIPLD